MVAKVNTQNAGDPSYEKLEGDSIALKAARALVFEGVTQPCGYKEPLLHRFRLKKKAMAWHKHNLCTYIAYTNLELSYGHSNYRGHTRIP
jgi:hypothetical protein